MFFYPLSKQLQDWETNRFFSKPFAVLPLTFLPSTPTAPSMLQPLSSALCLEGLLVLFFSSQQVTAHQLSASRIIYIITLQNEDVWILGVNAIVFYHIGFFAPSIKWFFAVLSLMSLGLLWVLNSNLFRLWKRKEDKVVETELKKGRWIVWERGGKREESSCWLSAFTSVFSLHLFCRFEIMGDAPKYTVLHL